MDASRFGPEYWRLYDFVLSQVPANEKTLVIDAEVARAVRRWFLHFPYVIPCVYCRISFRRFSTKLPPPPVDGSTLEDWIRWAWEIHNCVNRKLGKTTPADVDTLDKYRQRILRLRKEYSDKVSPDAATWLDESRQHYANGPLCPWTGSLWTMLFSMGFNLARRANPDHDRKRVAMQVFLFRTCIMLRALRCHKPTFDVFEQALQQTTRWDKVFKSRESYVSWIYRCIYRPSCKAEGVVAERWNHVALVFFGMTALGCTAKADGCA